jgi:hypothetical protein
MTAINRKQLFGLGVALIAILLMIEAWVAPPAHPVHSFGGSDIKASAYTEPIQQDADFYWKAGPAVESLSSIRCSHFTGKPTCGPADIAFQFPGLQQAAHTLYYVWTGCVAWTGAGPVIPWAGYNIEYFASSRTLVLHCYIGTGVLYFPDRLFGSVAQQSGTLLAIPTAAMGSGALRIDEDDRMEHLVGDSSNEYELTTATID